MNRYTLICRLRGPAYILLTGVIAMMAEWTSIGWGKSWPLYIVLEGVLQLAQRWALSNSNPPAGFSYTGMPVAGAYPGTVAPEPGTAIVAAPGSGIPEVQSSGSQSTGSHSTGPQSTEWRS